MDYDTYRSDAVADAADAILQDLFSSAYVDRLASASDIAFEVREALRSGNEFQAATELARMLQPGIDDAYSDAAQTVISVALATVKIAATTAGVLAYNGWADTLPSLDEMALDREGLI